MRYLNHITKIQRILTSKLPFDSLLGHKTFALPTNLEWESVTFQRPAKLEITDKYDDKVRIYTHKLIYRTCEEDINTAARYAYLLEDWMVEDTSSVLQQDLIRQLMSLKCILILIRQAHSTKSQFSGRHTARHRV